MIDAHVYVLFIYTISISILCVSQEELGLTESNQLICDLYKGVIFEDILELYKVHFWYQQIIQSM